MPLGPLLVFGNQQSLNTGASVLTLYCADPVVGGGNAGTLTTTQPATVTSATGWTVGTAAAGNISNQTYGLEVPQTNFQPSGVVPGLVHSAENAWRYGPLTGQFSGGTWYNALSVIAVTSGGDQSGVAFFAPWRSANPDGTNATRIDTGGTIQGASVINLSTTVAQSSGASFRVNAFPINNEYIFMQVEWFVAIAGTVATRDVLIRYGADTDVLNGSHLITSAFSATPSGVVLGGGAYRRRMLNWLLEA